MKDNNNINGTYTSSTNPIRETNKAYSNSLKEKGRQQNFPIKTNVTYQMDKSHNHFDKINKKGKTHQPRMPINLGKNHFGDRVKTDNKIEHQIPEKKNRSAENSASVSTKAIISHFYKEKPASKAALKRDMVSAELESCEADDYEEESESMPGVSKKELELYQKFLQLQQEDEDDRALFDEEEHALYQEYLNEIKEDEQRDAAQHLQDEVDREFFRAYHEREDREEVGREEAQVKAEIQVEQKKHRKKWEKMSKAAWKDEARTDHLMEHSKENFYLQNKLKTKSHSRLFDKTDQGKQPEETSVHHYHCQTKR